jgi:hypothetical protein
MMSALVPKMSALTPKADICSATRDVRFGPIADITASDSAVRSETEHAQPHGLALLRNHLQGGRVVSVVELGIEFTLELAAGLPNDGVFEAAPVVLEEPDIALFNLAAPLESRQCVAGETLVVLEAPGVEVGGGGFI